MTESSLATRDPLKETCSSFKHAVKTAFDTLDHEMGLSQAITIEEKRKQDAWMMSGGKLIIVPIGRTDIGRSRLGEPHCPSSPTTTSGMYQGPNDESSNLRSTR
jgi:hypothetical protein